MFTYKSLHGLAPTYLCDLLQPYIPSRSLRSADQLIFYVRRSRLKHRGNRVFAPKLWNAFPFHVRLAPTLPVFKSLQQHIFILWLLTQYESFYIIRLCLWHRSLCFYSVVFMALLLWSLCLFVFVYDCVVFAIFDCTAALLNCCCLCLINKFGLDLDRTVLSDRTVTKLQEARTLKILDFLFISRVFGVF